MPSIPTIGQWKLDFCSTFNGTSHDPPSSDHAIGAALFTAGRGVLASIIYEQRGIVRGVRKVDIRVSDIETSDSHRRIHRLFSVQISTSTLKDSPLGENSTLHCIVGTREYELPCMVRSAVPVHS